MIAKIVLALSLFFHLSHGKAVNLRAASNNPCLEANGGCDQYCSSSADNKTTCTCRKGFQIAYDHKTCIDVNECIADKNPCHGIGVCVNTIGSYSCQNFNCETLDLGLSNYFKSDICCKVDNREPQVEQNQVNDDNSFGIFLNQKITSQWPWMAQVIENNGYKLSHTCGAALVSNQWVVTSSQCVNQYTKKWATVMLGDVKNSIFKSDLTSTRVERKVIKVIQHHDDSSENDIALLKLSAPVQFNDLIQPIQLPCGESPSDWSICYVTGFGYKDEKSSSSSELLKEIALPIVPSDFCSFFYGRTDIKFNTKTMMCAGHIGGGDDACFGDGGGPLVCQRSDSCQWYLSGIVSNGKGCGQVRYPGIYTKVLQFENWIREIVGLKKQCK